MCRDWANTCRYFNLQSIHESILILLYFPNPPCLLSSQFQSLDVKIPAEMISSSSQCPIFSLVALLTTNHPTQDSFWPTICLLFNCGQMIVPATVLLHPTILSIINSKLSFSPLHTVTVTGAWDLGLAAEPFWYPAEVGAVMRDLGWSGAECPGSSWGETRE